MQGNTSARDAGRTGGGVSRRTVALILIPVLAAVGYLTWWAYQVSEWTWFALLLAAGIALVVFLVAPDLFSLTGRSAEPDWYLTIPKPVTLPQRPAERSSAAGATQARQDHKPSAPDRTA